VSDKVLVVLPSPISELQHALLPPKCCEPGSVSPTPCFFTVFISYSHLSLSRSLGVCQLCFFSTRMIPEFSKRSCFIWKTTIFKFVWSGQSSILSHLWAWRTLLWRYGLPYFFFLLHIHFPTSFYQILFLECCRPFWFKWLFWSGLLISTSFQWAHFVCPLLLRTSYKKVSMFPKRMSFTIGWTCLWCLCKDWKKPFWATREFHPLTF